MAEIKFNHRQLKNPTPASWVFGVRIYTMIATSIMAWMPTTTFVGHNFQDISTSILGLTVIIANGLLPFLGVETGAQRTVPIDEVTAMDTPKKE